MTPLEVWLAGQQRAFYAGAGLEAFKGAVPFRLSTSRAMAELVVKASLAFARQVGRRRVRLVDFGAGSGRLGWRVHQADERFRVALVDASERMVAGWGPHAQLGVAPRVSFHLGQAPDSAVLATEPDEARVVVGTYLLDTLPHALIDAATGHRAFVDDSGALHFAPAQTDSFVTAFCSRLGHGRAFMPLGAFEFIRQLEERTTGPTLLLVADKMAQTLEQAREPERLRIVAHGGGSSLLVNQPALRAWLGWRGFEEAPGSTSDFVVGATVLRRQGPVKGLFADVVHPLAAQQHVTRLREDPHLAQLAPEHAPDPDTLVEWAQTLVRQAPALDDERRKRVADWVLESARGAFFVPGDDVAFQAGCVLHALRFPRAAVACFSESLRLHGDVGVTRLHRARSLAELGALALAREDLLSVSESDPAHPQARGLLDVLESAGQPG